MGAQALANRQQCRPSLEGTKSTRRWEGGLGTKEPEHPWVPSFPGCVLAEKWFLLIDFCPRSCACPMRMFLLCLYLCFHLYRAWGSLGEKWYPGVKCHYGVTVLAFKRHKHDRICLRGKILTRPRTSCALSALWNYWPSESILMVQATGSDKNRG